MVDGGADVERIGVVGVFVGMPQVIGEARGREVVSAIAKQPVLSPTLDLGVANLAGDRQADLKVHGGVDKAVYLYPSEHYAAWQHDGFDVAVGGVGENVALQGADEHAILLGDVWRWGDALIQPSQPRAPCAKLTLHTGRRDIGPRMTVTRRSGWYARVLEPGQVPTTGSLVLEHRVEGAPTIHETYAARFVGNSDAERELVERVLAAPSLSDRWREHLEERRSRSR